MTLEESFENCRTEIERYEREYKLPKMLGTERQRPWARLIRREFLSELLPQVMESTKNLTGEAAKAVYLCLDKIRAENRSKVWIETVRPHQGAATALLLALPAAEAAAEAKEQEAAEAKRIRQEKSRQAIRDIKAAHAFDDQHGLPPVVGAGFSVKQENFGVRCRYWMLRELERSGVESIRPFLSRETAAAVWIAAYLGGKSVFDLMRANETPVGGAEATAEASVPQPSPPSVGSDLAKSASSHRPKAT